jgi:hypothetical protein
MTSRRAEVLIVVALLGVGALAVRYGADAWDDSGSIAILLFGIPAACAAIALGVERATRTTVGPALVAALAAVSVGWSLITGLGIGLVFLVPSFLLLAAAAASWGDRSRGAVRPLRT